MRLFLVSLFLVRSVAGAVCPISLIPTRTAFVTTVSVDGGKPLRFLVDTGSSRTVLDTHLGLTPSRWTIALTTSGPLRTGEATATVRAGKIERELAVLIADVPEFPSHGRIDGILGMDILAGHSFLLDTQSACLAVDVDHARGRAFEAEEIAGRVAIRVDGMNLVLDSGASFVVLLTERAQRLAVEHASFAMTSAAGRSTAKSATVRLFGRDLPAALVRGGDDREDALVPMQMFRRVWVSADRTRVRIE